MSSALAAVRGPAVAQFVADRLLLAGSTLVKNAIADATAYFGVGQRTAYRYWVLFRST